MPATTRRIHQSPKLPADQRRDQLLASAQYLFSRQGYRATTTEAIARRAGLTKGALYFHFKSKDDILSQLLKRAMEQFAAAFTQTGKDRLTPADVLSILRTIDAHRNIPRTRHSLDMRAEMLRVRQLRAHVNRMFRQAVDIVADLLDPAYGRSRQQRRQLTVLLFSLYDGWTLRRLISPEMVSFEHQVALFGKLMAAYRKARS